MRRTGEHPSKLLAESHQSSGRQDAALYGVDRAGLAKDARRHAFSLIEILITVGLLSFIILGLMLMFNQVQRAFRSSMTQTDVMESGRSIADMIVRDLEEMTPLQLPYDATNYPNAAVNFTTSLTAYSPVPIRQDLPGTTKAAGPWRFNTIQNFFFTSKS